MNTIRDQLLNWLVQLVGRGISHFADAIIIVMILLTLALAKLLKLGIVKDLGQLKENFLQRSKAKSDAESAKARKLEADVKLTLAVAAKTKAAAVAIRSKARREEMNSRATATAALIEATGKFYGDHSRLADPIDIDRIIEGKKISRRSKG